MEALVTFKSLLIAHQIYCLTNDIVITGFRCILVDSKQGKLRRCIAILRRDLTSGAGIALNQEFRPDVIDSTSLIVVVLNGIAALQLLAHSPAIDESLGGLDLYGIGPIALVAGELMLQPGADLNGKSHSSRCAVIALERSEVSSLYVERFLLANNVRGCRHRRNEASGLTLIAIFVCLRAIELIY